LVGARAVGERDRVGVQLAWAAVLVAVFVVLYLLVDQLL
jgi:hypothetical protein